LIERLISLETVVAESVVMIKKLLQLKVFLIFGFFQLSIYEYILGVFLLLVDKKHYLANCLEKGNSLKRTFYM
jgi:hypothetical protein